MRQQNQNAALVITVTPVYPPSSILDEDNTKLDYPRMANIFYLWKNKLEKVSNENGENENDGIQYWKVYFEFAYYTLICPFRFVWNPSTKTYNCYTNRFQTILHYTLFTILGGCYLLRLTTMWLASGQNHQILKLGEKENPTAYFDMAVYFFDSFFMLLLFLYFGKSSGKVFDVFRELQSTPFIQSRSTKYQRTRIWSTLILMVCIITVVMNPLELFQEQSWDIGKTISVLTKDAKVTFVFPEAVDAVPWIFISLSLASRLYQKILNDLGDILLTMSALLFKNLVDNFASILKSCESAEMVLEHYEWLKRITFKINLAVGFMNFAVIAGNLPFFATTVLEVFGTQTKNYFVRLRYIIACCYFFPSICLGAVANKKVEEMKEWICKKKNYLMVSDTRLMVFLHDLNYHSVGLTANGILTINWNSVGSIISIILTYALLKSQFNQDPICTKATSFHKN